MEIELPREGEEKVIQTFPAGSGEIELEPDLTFTCYHTSLQPKKPIVIPKLRRLYQTIWDMTRRYFWLEITKPLLFKNNI